MRKMMTAILAAAFLLSVVLCGCGGGKQLNIVTVTPEMTSGHDGNLTEPVATPEPVTTAGPETTAEPESTPGPESTAGPGTTPGPESTATPEPESTAAPETDPPAPSTEDPGQTAQEPPEPLELLQYRTSHFDQTGSGGILYMLLNQIRASRELSDFSEGWRTAQQREFDELHAEFLSAADDPSSETAGLTRFIRSAVPRRADDRILSLAFRDEYYYKDAEPVFSISSTLNLDPETGEELPLSAVVRDEEKLKEILLAAAGSRLPYAADDLDSGNFLWAVGYGEITFWLEDGDYLPAGASYVPLTVSFADHEDLFTERALNVPERYIIPVPLNEEMTLPGWQELLLSLQEEETAYGSYAVGITLTVNGRSLIEKIPYGEEGAPEDAYLLHEDGLSDLLYVTIPGLNGFARTCAFRIDGDAPERIGDYRESLGRAYYVIEEDSSMYLVFREIPTDPRHFPMETPMHLLSSYSAHRYYARGADGLPQPLSDWYGMIVERVLTLLQDLELPSYDRDTGTAGAAVSLHTGDTLQLIAADGDSRVLAVTEDGTVVLIELEYGQDSWQPRVNGIDIDDLFDGMMFAG